MYNHSDFISSSISEILETAIRACSGVGIGIETYPLCEYVMQSIFLKMTGFQEQKMKFICWELASNDYEYRREYSRNSLGECSSYADKQLIYKDIIKQINKNTLFEASSLDKQKILLSSKTEVSKLFENTNLLLWAQSDFYNFTNIWNGILESDFANDNNNLFTEVKNRITLKQIYNSHLYLHRNRIAHNTQSYQKNLPRLETLINDNFKYENYFVWFSILILLDKIFIDLFKSYQDSLLHKLY
ncbi:hypothetical protein [Empedobacter brevis]|uniref:hypothetical protein n=1 Tax=Empedobacter brevis TaxID=247 RepID=UPI0033405694